MISVVIPLYNKQDLIVRTLESVLAQTYTDFEVLVVDDGSTDASAERALSVEDPRIRLISQQNAGVSAARNRGIAEARGEWIALLDADDLWKPEYLAEMMRLADKYPQCKVLAANYIQNDNGKIIPTKLNRIPFEDTDGILSNYFEVASYSSPPIWTSAVIVSKDAYQEVDGFPKGVKSGEDLLTWAKLAAKFRIAFTKKQLATFNLECYNVKEKPKRTPPTEDYVGNQLKIINKNHKIAFLKRYRSHWKKMRASVFMRRGMKTESIRECIEGIKLSPLNFKLYIYIALNLIGYFGK